MRMYRVGLLRPAAKNPLEREWWDVFGDQAQAEEYKTGMTDSLKLYEPEAEKGVTVIMEVYACELISERVEYQS